jgi:hypothetical protein
MLLTVYYAGACVTHAERGPELEITKYEQQTMNNFFVTNTKYRPEKGPSRLCLVCDISHSEWLLSTLFFNFALKYATYDGARRPEKKIDSK